ncbi:MAG TPA: hypothetical protein VG347_11020 [Verrucomicrobiae bacterium]|nr:hypothetical protein [Verrucomicrobiae bacterium]
MKNKILSLPYGVSGLAPAILCLLSSILFTGIHTSVCAQNAALLDWNAATNRLVGSSFVVTRRTDAGALDVYDFPSNQCVFTAAQLADGLNRFAVAQIATNPAGTAALTPFSGEVWVAKSSVVVAEPRSTNIFILTSTNLGLGDWAFAGTNSVTFPTTEAQRYFKAVADLQIRRTNQLTFPTTP